MYLEIFLADFAVFRFFLGISRDFAEIPEFRGSATARNIRSPVSVIEPVEVSPVELDSISSTSADSVTECSIAGGSASSGWLLVLEAGFTADAVLHVAVAVPATLTRFFLGSSMVSEPAVRPDIAALTAYKDNFITGLETAKVIFRRILQRQINNKFSMTTRIDLSRHSFISRGYRFFFRSTVYTGEYAYSELVPL